MSAPIVSIIAAIGSNRELGKDNKLLWHIPEDLARFQKITLGHPVIMGRTTFESLGKPLSCRTNIVITRNKEYAVPGCIIAYSIDQAIDIAKIQDKNEIFIIGGGQIYEQGIKLANKLYLTIVEGSFAADTFFPDYSRYNKVLFRQKGQFGKYKYIFLVLTP